MYTVSLLLALLIKVSLAPRRRLSVCVRVMWRVCVLYVHERVWMFDVNVCSRVCERLADAGVFVTRTSSSKAK